MPEGFWISPSNPNAEQGGGDLITPTHQTIDVRGPWVVFPNVDCAEAQGQVPLPHAALPISTIKAILAEASGVQADETGGAGDIRDKIAEPAKETVDWEDIPVDEQNALADQFPKGGRTRTRYGVTTIPTAAPLSRVTDPSANLYESSALKEIAAELPLETPDEHGGYSPVEEPEDAPTI